MNTPAHLLIGAAAFARPGDRGATAAAVAGSLAPDISIYAFVFWQRLVLGRDAVQVFGYDYREAFWQGVFAVDNSIVLWGALLAGALALARWPAVVFAAAGLIHVCIDFALHASDARRHLWPLSDWVFRSPVSYWEPERWGWLVGPLELGLCIALAWVLWRRFRGGFARALVALAVLLEAAPVLLSPVLFASG